MASVDTDVYYTTAEAADELGISQDSVRRYCANHLEDRTPAIRGELIGRSWFIHPDELERFKKERRGMGRPKSGK
ncbi:MAG: helix-turn-helix domain-containing protein [Planctomycetota bacterium]